MHFCQDEAMLLLQALSAIPALGIWLRLGGPFRKKTPPCNHTCDHKDGV